MTLPRLKLARRIVSVAAGIPIVVAAVPVFLIEWTVIALLRDKRARWRYASRSIRRFARLARIRLVYEPSVIDLPIGGSMIVSNHSSFLDALILLAWLPHPACFVAASEFSDKPLFGSLLRRMDVEFVHRDEPRKAAGDLRRLVSRLRDGDQLIIFPEGSLSPALGIRDFHVGAFFAAARANAPIIPVAITGANIVLRPETHIPRSGCIYVSAGSLVPTRGSRRSELETVIKDVRRQVITLSDLPDASQSGTGIIGNS